MTNLGSWYWHKVATFIVQIYFVIIRADFIDAKMAMEFITGGCNFPP